MSGHLDIKAPVINILHANQYIVIKVSWNAPNTNRTTTNYLLYYVLCIQCSVLIRYLSDLFSMLAIGCF